MPVRATTTWSPGVSEIKLDPYLQAYAHRMRGATASEIRALFSVASRPEVVSLAGGMAYTAALDFDAVAEVTQEVLRRDGPTALQYGGGQGMPELRERLVEVMAVEGGAAHPDDLVVTTGGQQALDLIAKLFCDPGDVVLAEGPTYVGALSALSTYQPQVIHLPMDEEGLIPEALAQALEYLAANGRRAKFLYTVPNHQNPAGVSLSPKRREQIVDLALTHNLLVVEDNPYGLLDFKGEVRTPLAALAPEQVIYVGTLSKILSPGLRVGWIAASPPIRDKLILLKEAADLSQSNLTQHIAERWFATQPWLEQIEAFREVYRERCDAMLEALATDFPPGCTWSVPTGGFFVWLRLPPGLNSGELLAQALNARVAYVPGRAFYADDSGSDAMRLSFCYPTPEQIRAGVARLAEVVREEIELVRAVYGDREP